MTYLAPIPSAAPSEPGASATLDLAEPNWTPAKMAAFLRQLAAAQSVSAAARSVGMSRQSAYKLRARLKGQPFDIAWKCAVRRNYDALTEAASLAAGDLVVHVDHGIGRFIGLKAIEAGGAPHDCVEIEYAGGKLYLPVENIELLSRYGSEDTGVQLDKLGGVAWQAKKSRLKQRIREMAEQLIKIAAARLLSRAEPVDLPSGAYEEFAARFPYEETEDQMTAIEAVYDDLTSGKVMDRLVCGDVGFGKTEVALRAAFGVALAGRQVAVVVPTTLLARQHFKTFRERFAGLPVRVAQASRLVSAAELKATKEGLADGQVDIAA